MFNVASFLNSPPSKDEGKSGIGIFKDCWGLLFCSYTIPKQVYPIAQVDPNQNWNRNWWYLGYVWNTSDNTGDNGTKTKQYWVFVHVCIYVYIWKCVSGGLTLGLYVRWCVCVYFRGDSDKWNLMHWNLLLFFFFFCVKTQISYYTKNGRL